MRFRLFFFSEKVCVCVFYVSHFNAGSHLLCLLYGIRSSFFLLSISFLGLLPARFLKFLVTRELTSNSFRVAHPLCDVHGGGWTGGADAGLQAFIGTLCSQRERNVVQGRCSCSSCTFITNGVYQRHLTRLRCTTLCNSLHKKSADASLKDGLWLKLHRAGPILIKCLDIWKIPKKKERLVLVVYS